MECLPAAPSRPELSGSKHSAGNTGPAETPLVPRPVPDHGSSPPIFAHQWAWSLFRRLGESPPPAMLLTILIGGRAAIRLFRPETPYRRRRWPEDLVSLAS